MLAKRIRTADKNEQDHEAFMVKSGRWLLVDESKLNLGNSYASPEKYYKDKEFDCVDCGAEEVWTAAQQKWWYEEARGYYFATAIRCRDCRKNEQTRKEEARKVHLDGVQRKNQQPT